MISFLLILVVLLFKDPQLSPAALLPAASAGLHWTSCQIISPGHFYCDAFGLCTCEKKLCDCADRQDVVSQIRLMHTHTGRCSAPHHREVWWCAGSRGLAEVSRPAESSRAAFISRIQLLLDRRSFCGPTVSTVTYLEMCERYFWVCALVCVCVVGASKADWTALKYCSLTSQHFKTVSLQPQRATYFPHLYYRFYIKVQPVLKVHISLSTIQ